MYKIKGFIGYNFIFDDKETLRAWIDGAVHALYSFAVWDDGKMYIGSTGKTYESAVTDLYEQYKLTTGEEYK